MHNCGWARFSWPQCVATAAVYDCRLWVSSSWLTAAGTGETRWGNWGNQVTFDLDKRQTGETRWHWSDLQKKKPWRWELLKLLDCSDFLLFMFSCWWEALGSIAIQINISTFSIHISCCKTTNSTSPCSDFDSAIQGCNGGEPEAAYSYVTKV